MTRKLVLVTTMSAAAMAVLTLSAQAPKTQWDGIYTTAQAERGAAKYKQRCASCHRSDLSGGAVEGSPALNDADFAANWDGTSVGDIYDKIKMLMPQDDPGILTEQEATDVLSFILSQSGYPAGATDLSMKVDDLKAIKFVAKKPA
jgi:mono/diheme cytochrome c family protein